MSTTPKEYSPYVGPDALRQYAHLMEKFYGLHTDRYYGHQDIEGSQYEGTVENWGSEMLMEARKMYMIDPPLRNIFVENTLDYYFEVKHSHIIDTYDQQNMLVVLLRKDVLLSDREYRIRFDDLTRKTFPRSLSSSANKVYRDEYYHTTTPPTLVISKEGEEDVEISLKLSDEVGSTTDYYFHCDFDAYLPGGDTPIPHDGTLITDPLKNEYNGYPFIWICTSQLQLLPDVGFVDNTFKDKDFMVIGTNGHARSLTYPLINNDLAVVEDIYELTHWLVKVQASHDDGFTDEIGGGKYSPFNYTARIGSIELMYFEDASQAQPGIEPTSSYMITYDPTYCKLCLNKDISFDQSLILDTVEGRAILNILPTATNFGKWFFHTPVDGDYDYDGATYVNPTYGYTSMLSFICNMLDYPSSDPYITAGFVVVFDDKYLNDYETICENAYAGVHVDVTSDHSDNGVSKKNGVIHNMGDFDGLPSYFSYMIDDNIHRAHIEAYAIRDQLNKRNQKATDKPTAAVIIDSGIPKNEVNDIVLNGEPVIYYSILTPPGKYTYNENDKTIDPFNALSEITFSDENHFGNSKMEAHANEKKFIYHGNRHFSLTVSEFDPEKEYGRVYLVTNDRSVYENNETAIDKKPASTFARICDIPTNFSQLVYIKGTSPTIIIDPEYVRTNASYDNSDKEALYNVTTRDHLMKASNSIVFFEYNAPDAADMANAYPTYINLNDTIDISDENVVTYSIVNGGSGYVVDDTAQFYIGGNSIEVVVTAESDGVVTGFKFADISTNPPTLVDMPVVSNQYQVRTNFASNSVVYDTETKSGEGTGLRIGLDIDQTEWDSTEPSIGVIPSLPTFCFKMDHEGILWVDALMEFDADIQSFQITASKVYYNPYDIDSVGTTETMIKDIIVPMNNDYIDSSTNVVKTFSNIDKGTPARDFSPELNRLNANRSDSMFIIVDGPVTSSTDDIIRYEINHVGGNQDTTTIPYNSDINVGSYQNKSNKLRYSASSDDEQPKVLVYDSNKTTVDTMETIMKDVTTINTSRAISMADIFESSDLTPETLVSATGNIDRDIYIFDEYDDSNLESYRSTWSEYTHRILIDIISSKYPNSEPVQFEGTPYQYSDKMLVEYMMNNCFNWSDWNDETRPATIYRKPEIKMFRNAGDQIIKNGLPNGKQPKGGFVTASDTVVPKHVKVDAYAFNVSPLNIFRIDTESPVSLNGFRLYDEMDNDISKISLIILNGVILYPNYDNLNNIRWLPINRTQASEEDRT